ncbi:thioredoxin fold domain-containing protein [Glaciecola sp. XM2]|jgi:thiol:disulfide interchange protein DsbC|uniref:thioredoxin fold domain-containing protein n=1 Tax=Glaciecola sp. XM2 TaxID=1914931 RepID=UPI001BDDCAA7|nr:thioredoxin fold domain-containing protein [Glaciecola sp. XM2]MBT1451059.1 thioredoxin fold domain-containing protein [Glaciecola sp. XM2]
MSQRFTARRFTALVAAFVALIFSSTLFAQQDNEDLALTLGVKLQLRIDSVANSPVPGLLELYTDRGLFYASEDGEYFLQARVYNVADGIVDVTEESLKKMRLDGIGQFADSAIEFTAENEKYVIHVFTDATCGYCRKLHNEIDQINDLGITVRYLSFPRAGINSQVYLDAVSIWCSENPQEAITKAKAGEQVADASCANKVSEQFSFGQKIGVNGTPNIVLPDGSVVPGYQPAKQLELALQAMN